MYGCSHATTAYVKVAAVCYSRLQAENEVTESHSTEQYHLIVATIRALSNDKVADALTWQAFMGGCSRRGSHCLC